MNTATLIGVSRFRPRPIPSHLVRSAGAVVWRFRDPSRQAQLGQIIKDEDIEILIVHRPRYNDWSWPKGKSELGEPIVSAAVREVEEETGEIIRLGLPLTVQRYRLGSGQIKEVRYWVGHVAEHTPAARVRPPVERAPRREIDQARWVSPSKADRLLTRRGDRRLLTEVLAHAHAGTLVTMPLVVLRHAKAVSRSSWNGGEGERVLTRSGVRQSLAAIDMLSAFGVSRLVSSEWTRCVQTLLPYAGLAGVPMDMRAELTEAAAQEHPEGLIGTARGVLEDLSEPTVMCAHRPTLPSIFSVLQARSNAQVQLSFPQESPWLGTAEAVIAHVAQMPLTDAGGGERVVLAVERHGVSR